MKKILSFAIYIFLILHLFSQNIDSTAVFNSINENISNNNYIQALKIISNTIAKDNYYNSFLVDRAFYIFTLYNDKNIINDFLKNTLFPTKNSSILNQAFLECYENKYFPQAMKIFYFMTDNNISISIKYRSYITEIVHTLKKDKEFNTYITKTIMDKTKNDNIRLFLLSLVNDKNKMPFFSYFDQNSTQFKNYLLVYYFEHDQMKFKSLYDSLKHTDFRNRSIYIGTLFSLGQYQLVINMVNKNDTPYIERDFYYNGIFQTLLDSYILLNKYKQGVNFLLKYPSKLYILSRLQAIGIKNDFYKFLYEQLIKKKINIPQNTMLKIAYLTDDKDLFTHYIINNYNEKNLISLFSRVNFYYNLNKKKKFLLSVTKIMLNNDLLSTGFAEHYIDFLNKNHCFEETFDDFQNYFRKINFNNPDLIDYYKIIFHKIAISEVNIVDPSSSYGKKLSSMRNFSKGNYGQLITNDKEFKFIDNILFSKNTKPEDILGYLKNNINMDFMTVMRYLYFKKYDANKNAEILKNYALVKFLNEKPFVQEDMEITIFFRIYYDYKRKNFSELEKDYNKYKVKLNLFQKICKQMVEEAKNEQ